MQASCAVPFFFRNTKTNPSTESVFAKKKEFHPDPACLGLFLSLLLTCPPFTALPPDIKTFLSSTLRESLTKHPDFFFFYLLIDFFYCLHVFCLCFCTYSLVFYDFNDPNALQIVLPVFLSLLICFVWFFSCCFFFTLKLKFSPTGASNRNFAK